MIYRDGPALSSAPEDLQHSWGRLLEGPIDGNLFCHDHVRAACPMEAVVFSHPG
jgi:hypothetical protein